MPPRNEGSAMNTRLIEFLRNESGTVILEYGLIASGIAGAVATVVQTLGPKLKIVLLAAQSALT